MRDQPTELELAQLREADGIVREACANMDRAGVPIAAGWLAFLRYIACSAQTVGMPQEEFITRVRCAWDDMAALRAASEASEHAASEKEKQNEHDTN